MDENVAAPALTGEAAPLTTNPEVIAPATPETPPIFTPEQAQEIKAFFDNNGGFEKVKKNLTMRQTDMQPQMPTPQPPMPDAQMQIGQNITNTPYQPQQPQQPAPQSFKGGITQEEFMIHQYFTNLANNSEYASIANEIANGKVLEEMRKFDIDPIVNGVFNDTKIRNFLSMYAKTVPATPAENPVTTTPTVEYVQVGETITNMNDAMRVLQQDQQLRAQGQPGHPMAKVANEFFDNALNANQNRGRVEHTTLAEAKKK